MGQAPDTEISVEVVFALPDDQVVQRVTLARGATVGDAVAKSGLLERFPALAVAVHKTGVFGKIVETGTILDDGDRVEIYRPLTVDPKEARRRRVALRAAKHRNAASGS